MTRDLEEVKARANDVPSQAIFAIVKFISRTEKLLDIEKTRRANDSEIDGYLKHLDEFRLQLVAANLRAQQQWNKPPEVS